MKCRADVHESRNALRIRRIRRAIVRGEPLPFQQQQNITQVTFFQQLGVLDFSETERCDVLSSLVLADD